MSKHEHEADEEHKIKKPIRSKDVHHVDEEHGAYRPRMNAIYNDKEDCAGE